MRKYRSVTGSDIRELDVLRIEKVVPLFLNDGYDNIMIFNTDEQTEYFRGKSGDIPKECKSWVIESWDLQLINEEPYICFNASWNDYD